MRAADKQKIANVSFSAIISSVCIVLMLLCRFISFTDYAVSALCGLFIGVVVIESGKRWAFASYIVVSILGLLLGGNECAVTFIVFLGYYPIIKIWIEKLNKILAYIIKFITFNSSIISIYFILDKLNFIPFEDVSFLGEYTVLAVLILANIAFLVYDFAFNGIMNLYYLKFHSKINKIIKK